MARWKKGRKQYVYELVNSKGKVEYVGETYNPEQRLLDHTQSAKGKFKGRTDLKINVVAEFDNRKDAYAYQCKLQNQYGWVSDLDKHQIKLTCPHCNYTSIGYGIYRNHFNRCKQKTP